MVSVFQEIRNGFLISARKTSPSLAVCEFPDATVTKGFLARSGLSTAAVTRMLPALAAWAKTSGDPKDLDIVRRIFLGACDPAGEHYWMPANAQRNDQRQVESSIVAWSLWLLRDEILTTLSGAERRNISNWLASCTRVPVRFNNWAWFTALNLAVRQDLSAKWPEFAGDEQFMLDDLKALDAMAGADGWYNDGVRGQGYDYYNSWVFASHYLYWNQIAGKRYPRWAERFQYRLDEWLKTFPHFFATDGGHVLYGRSLIYRWAVLTPLILAYLQKSWPHPPALLKRLVRGNVERLWELGAFDSGRGKLRESISAEGTPRICETYIGGGDVYWGMQAFSMFLIPPSDEFWTGPEAPLPVERAGYSLPLKGPGLLIAGARPSGHVRLIQARSTRLDAMYRDKYNKFAYSSHFPFCVNWEKSRAPWDNTLLLFDATTGETITRGEFRDSQVSADRVETTYPLGNLRVRTIIVVDEEWEGRVHYLIDAAPLSGWVLREGSYPLGFSAADRPEQKTGPGWISVRNPRTACLAATWRLAGWHTLEAWAGSGENTVHPRYVINSLTTETGRDRRVLASVHYASPKPIRWKDIMDGAARMRTRLGFYQ